MRTVYKIFTNAILVLLIVLAALLIVPRFLGITPMAVLSGSMEPTYHVGSMLYVKSEAPENIKQGDPITFRINENTMVTHRVIAIDSANQCFYTKGDNNDVPDGGSVAFANLVGKPVFSLPLLGYLAVYASSTSGIIIMVCVILIVLILTFLPDFLFSDDKKDDADENKNEEEKQKRRKKK